MTVIARFKCQSVLQQVGQEQVSLQPVYSSKEGTVYNTWSKYTPSGKLDMTISNEAIFGFFKPGQDYAIAIEPIGDEG